ncbi:hypothetical protein CAT56_03630 [Acinetobacter nosocomialis]|nr:hypothetical protein CAT56_03630 [Acinetobacter nosocomialis]
MLPIVCHYVKIVIHYFYKTLDYMDKKIENLDEELINRFMGTAIIDKEINNFLGFLEGIILDHTINKKEIYALQVWMERNPEIYCQYPFDHLIHLLGQTVIGSQKLDEEKCKQFVEVIKIFISGKFYSKNTRDVQRLHGLLAGVVCDGTLSIDEAKALNTWMKEHDYLEDDVFFQEVYTSLRPVRTKQDDLTDFDIQALFKQIKRYVDPDDHGTLRTKIETIDNPDFFKGQLLIENALYCFTGTSSRFKKKDWKALIENNGGKFIDDMTTTVNYLVICNKGNKAWAHVSYGRKFEEAKKWQQQGHDIKIITEDDFIQAIGLPIEN